MATTLNVYSTYSFKDKDPVIDKLRTIKKDTGMSDKQIHEAYGVSMACLHGWFKGKTRRPQHPTVMAVVHALGYDYRMVKVGKAKKK